MHQETTTTAVAKALVCPFSCPFKEGEDVVTHLKEVHELEERKEQYDTYFDWKVDLDPENPPVNFERAWCELIHIVPEMKDDEDTKDDSRKNEEGYFLLACSQGQFSVGRQEPLEIDMWCLRTTRASGARWIVGFRAQVGERWSWGLWPCQNLQEAMTESEKHTNFILPVLSTQLSACLEFRFS